MVEILRYLVSHTYYTLVNRTIFKVCGVFIHTGGGVCIGAKLLLYSGVSNRFCCLVMSLTFEVLFLGKTARCDDETCTRNSSVGISR